MDDKLITYIKGCCQVQCQTNSVAETQAFGESFGIFLKNYKFPLCLALVGDLGTGKTHFSQGVAKGFGYTGQVVSPTFALMNTYEVKRQILYHFDLYRLDSPEELENIGFSEYTDKTKSLVEWADKFKEHMPEGLVWIFLEAVSVDSRLFTIYSPTLVAEDLEKIGGSYVLGN